MITRRQKDTLDFIKKYIAKNNFPPTIREIGEGINTTSSATAFVHVKKLEDNGYIEIGKNKSRNITLLCPNEYEGKKDLSLTLLNNNELVNITTLLDLNESFLYKQTNDTLTKYNIYKNDYLIIKKTKLPLSGNLVLVETKFNYKEIREYNKDKEIITLSLDNQSPIKTTTPKIFGVVTGIYKKL